VRGGLPVELGDFGFGLGDHQGVAACAARRLARPSAV